VLEPPLQYHYLARPYELEPLTVEAVPRPSRHGELTVYDLRIRPGVRYAPHPCFAPDATIRAIPPEIRDISDLPAAPGRELEARDYVLAIKRLADPTLDPPCPILPLMAKYVDGLEAFAAALRRDLEMERARRRAAGGALYDAPADEQARPIVLDLDARALAGARALDARTLRISIRGRYPQILYWLATPFFAPIPAEALAFYARPELKRRNLTLDRYPVGTGPYRIEAYDRNREIRLVRNEAYRDVRYPSRGEPSDRAMGLLEDAGKRLPFIDRIVMRLEKESIPRWIKFQQGWYDASGIPSESFDQIVRFAEGGELSLGPSARERHWTLQTEVELTTYYMAFNMLDDVVGGYTEARRKLRRAVAIAIDTEERIQIFHNGLGRPAMSLLPPGLFGFEDGLAGMDPYVYTWDAKARAPRRRSLDEARRLLAEAGYPGGRDRTGRQLEIRFANAWTSPEQAAVLRWLTQKLEAIGIRLVSETTDYNRFQEKVAQGNFQMLSWGWHADYPDPENFLFLLYGPNGRKHHHGENHSNYDSEEFNRIFERLETMENSPERLQLIRAANRIAQRDTPLVWGFHPMSLGLSHQWVRNVKPHAVAQGTLKYVRLDARLRDARRAEWNRPIWWPLAAVAVILAALVIPAVLAVRRRAELA
jgi:oligopeptide transport system substrate-binding protein